MSASADAEPAVIVNTGSNQWLESLAITDGTASGRGTGKLATVTLVIAHESGQPVTGLAIDDDWDATDESESVEPRTDIVVQSLPGLNESRVTYSWLPPRPSGRFTCDVNSQIRRIDIPLRIAAVTDDGLRSAPVTRNVHMVEDDDCGGIQDYAHVWNQSQSATTLTPGSSANFTFTADDRDVECWTAYRWRTRNLTTGAISGTSDVNFTSCQDNATKTQSVSFGSRGRFVVEARLASGACAFGSCTRDYQDDGTNGWFRLGAVDVNTAAASSPTASVAAPSSAVVGSSFDVSATVADPSDAAAGGAVHRIEWDTDDDGVFDTVTDAANRTTGLSNDELTVTVDTASAMPGPFTVRARVTDNGAISAGDTIGRQKTAQAIVVLTNEAPVADDQSVETDEDTPVAITLTGSDPDGHALSFSVASPPADGDVTGDAPAVTYTPAANFNGADQFTFTVSDGYGGTAAGTVSITVHPVNDAPVADAQSVATDEDTAVEITLTGSDVEDDPLTFAVTAGPSGGTLDGTGSALTYTPAANFFGTDAFTFVASDGALDSEPATVTIEVAPVNDAPVADDQAVSTHQETPVSITLTGSDVEGDPISFTVTGGPSDGTLSGAGASLVYTPDEGFTGTDSFTFVASDGITDGEPATVTISVGPLIETSLSAEPAVANLQSGGVTLTLAATLTQADTDAVVAGETIEFRIGDELVCAAVTGPDGRASCGGVVEVVKVILAGSYTATFAKRPPFAGSAATAGPIVV